MSGKINELISQVAKDFKQDKFDKFIHEINFPKFKGFAPGTKIKIYFPICVIVGPNGGGKSSVLQAAWGMPQDHSTSRFWFSTPVDPIDNKSGNQNRYWYSHYVKALDQQVQCRKISGNKRNGYWEPSRPNLGEGMARIPPKDAQNTIYMSSTGDRWNQVVRTPHYINAKAESSAFDRFFYFSDLASLDRKQNHFVKYSRRLKQVIELDLKHSRYYGLERVFSNFLIPSEQLKSINDILQKKYRSARYVMHAFYDKNRSPSVIFETRDLNYSECFAGSGELAVVNLVLALDKIKEFDLLLLDEPETSLHPGAQVKLIEYLLRVVKDKKIQVLISTHSPTFVEKLPLESLIVLDENDQGTIVRNNITKATAFDRLGQYGTNKILLLTEDELCKALVERSVDHIAPEFAKLVVVEAANVGASEMLSNQTKAYIQSDSKVIMILDGDQRPVEEMFLQKPAQLSLLQKEELIRQLKDLGVSISYPAEKNIDVWMDWCANHVVLIEETCPEQVLLKLLKNNHPMLSSAEATNSKFKDAVRKQLYRTRDKLDSSAQYNILRYELGRLSEGSDIRESLIRLARRLEEKIKQIESKDTK